MILLKKKILVLVIMALLITLTGTVAASPSVRVFVDGAEVQFPDQKPIINSDNRTLVPVRFVSEALGADIEWIALTRTVKVDYQDKTILLEVGLKQAVIGTSIITLDTKAEIVGDRTMVPLRFVSECLDAEVEWDGDEQAVYITTADSDQSLVDSDLVVNPLYSDSKPGDLSVNILYKWTTPVEPQLVDLKELLEKRFGSKAQEIVNYIAVKKDAQSRILDKDWVIDGKNIRVTDYVGSVSVTVWG